MRTLPDGLKAHLQETCTTLAHCWIVKRKDGVRLGFTDHDQTLLIESVNCRAETGLQPTQAISQLGFASDNVDVAGALNDASISASDIETGRYDDASIEVWLVNWAKPVERVRLHSMIVGEITREDDLFRAELRGFTALLDKQQGRSYVRTCDAELGDGKCRVNLDGSTFVSQGSVSDVIETGTFTTNAMIGYESGWFASGTVRWLTGDNSGTVQRIGQTAEPVSTHLRLWDLPPDPIATGDTFILTAGCDKRFETCKEKFANLLNFRGFPHVPGNDFAMNYAANSTDHDGSPLVP